MKADSAPSHPFVPCLLIQGHQEPVDIGTLIVVQLEVAHVATRTVPLVRMTRNELKELLLATGLEMLREEGLGTGAERLTFKRVFDRVEDERGLRVTNASVIRRIWRDNQDYQADVLTLVVSEELSEAVEAAAKKAEQVLRKADLSSPGGRRAAVSELCRQAGGAHADALTESRAWHLFIAAWGNIASRPESDWDQRISEAARATYAEITRRDAEVMAGLAETVGLQLRPGFTLQQFVLAVVAFSEGCALRDRIDPASTRRVRLPSGPGGRRQDWRLFAVGLEALVWHFFELKG